MGAPEAHPPALPAAESHDEQPSGHDQQPFKSGELAAAETEVPAANQSLAYCRAPAWLAFTDTVITTAERAQRCSTGSRRFRLQKGSGQLSTGKKSTGRQLAYACGQRAARGEGRVPRSPRPAHHGCPLPAALQALRAS